MRPHAWSRPALRENGRGEEKKLGEGQIGKKRGGKQKDLYHPTKAKYLNNTESQKIPPIQTYLVTMLKCFGHFAFIQQNKRKEGIMKKDERKREIPTAREKNRGRRDER